LAWWFWRRSLKCEKLTDDGRQVMAIVAGELKIKGINQRKHKNNKLE
jgi:hypothetical protein